MYFGHAMVCGGPGQDPCPDPTSDYSLVVVDTATGTLSWELPIEGHIWGSPMVFGTYTGEIYALDADDMEIQWTYSTGTNPIQASVAVSPDGRLFFGDWNGIQHSIGGTDNYLCE